MCCRARLKQVLFKPEAQKAGKVSTALAALKQFDKRQHAPIPVRGAGMDLVEFCAAAPADMGHTPAFRLVIFYNRVFHNDFVFHHNPEFKVKNCDIA